MVSDISKYFHRKIWKDIEQLETGFIFAATRRLARFVLSHVLEEWILIANHLFKWMRIFGQRVCCIRNFITFSEPVIELMFPRTTRNCFISEHDERSKGKFDLDEKEEEIELRSLRVQHVTPNIFLIFQTIAFRLFLRFFTFNGQPFEDLWRKVWGTQREAWTLQSLCWT